MTGDALGDLDATGLAELVRSGQASPAELVDAAITRIEALNPKLNAVIHPRFEPAREEAAGPLPEGPFRGVPFLLKDILCHSAGDPFHEGMRFLKELDWRAKDDTYLAAKYKAAGLVVLGRTNTPELGIQPTTEPEAYGATLNPWDPTRSPGGSSGGSAAAVAAGMVPAAHANDGGGSIRIPASCCGLVGLKPSRGRVPSRSYSWEGASTDGAVTRTVADAAALLDAVCGPDPLCWWNAPPPAGPFADHVGAEPGSLRIGLVERAPLGLPLDSACAEAVRHGADLLDGLGHTVEPVEFDTLPQELIEAFVPVVRAGLAEYDDVDWARVEPHNAAALQAAREIDSLAYRAAVRALQSLTRPIVAAWGRDFDVLLTPTLSIEPPEVGAVLQAAHASPGEPAEPVMRMVAFTLLANVTGLPAVSLPLHISDSGLPIGVQLVGAPWDEAGLIRLAAQLERAEPWADRQPDLERVAAEARPSPAV